MKRILSYITIALLGWLMLSPVSRAQDPINLQTQSESFELEVIRLMNAERTLRGLPPLARNDNLTTAARAHNADMIANNFFDHTGSNGSTASERACAAGFAPYGWGRCYAGENIAAGYTTPAAVMAGWMSSGGHRANILNSKYREVGVGHTTGGSWGNYWTMDLGAQPRVLPVFVNNNAAETTDYHVTVTLTKEDVSSWGSIGSISGVQLSSDPGFTGASWQAWAPSLNFDLPRGSGQKTVYVRYTDGHQTVTGADTITLNEPLPSLSLSAEQIIFLSQVGSGQPVPSVVTLHIANTGSEVLHWTAGSSQSWLQLSATGGDAPATVQVTVTNSGGILNGAAGSSTTANITIFATNAGALNSPQTIPVTLRLVDTIYTTHLPQIHK